MNDEMMDKLIMLIAVLSGVTVCGAVWLLSGILQRWMARRKIQPALETPSAAALTPEAPAPPPPDEDKPTPPDTAEQP